MAAGNVATVMHAPGRLVVTPTTAFATGTFPFGGTEVGKVQMVLLTPVGQQPYRPWSEGLGAATDSLEPQHRWVVTTKLRGWDDDAIAQFFARSYSAGTESQRAVFSAPGTRLAGASQLGLALKIAFVPDDQVHNPGFILYRAVPHWGQSAEMAFQRRDELGIPLALECFHDESSPARILKIGRMADLAL